MEWYNINPCNGLEFNSLFVGITRIYIPKESLKILSKGGGSNKWKYLPTYILAMMPEYTYPESFVSWPPTIDSEKTSQDVKISIHCDKRNRVSKVSTVLWKSNIKNDKTYHKPLQRKCVKP